ncbi:hypothetical protein WN51_06279 [Melipona quadrifasciata]|uniref:Uncharacterized protein n=1 Tax=Melipona quadrifasciata TaxID=166423 RepID=A0A0N0BCD9_9HYME|nr:hypothetical protein WN51_06279 [Melipona quadrifasciata]
MCTSASRYISVLIGFKNQQRHSRKILHEPSIPGRSVFFIGTGNSVGKNSTADNPC